ncbi:hypothetical protein [Nonomuraea dietziae]|uniref:hypothetical protein n=1 Tax=Nonomuraea dietziae TaxID=65515 RepID=UPI0033EF9650
MGVGRRRTAVSVGLLAFALAALPLGAGAATAGLRDCERGGGLLSGVTNGVCELVDGVTDTVDGVTGDSLGPVTDGVDKATGTVLGTVGEVAPTGRPAPSPTSKAADEPPPPSSDDGGGDRDGGGLVSSTLEDVCLPVLACEGQGVLGSVPDPGRPEPSPSGSPSATGTPTPSATATPSRRPRQQGILPTEAPAPPVTRPHMESTDPVVADEPAPVDPDDPRVELLWPGPFSEKLSDQIGGRVVRPSEPDSDVLGTALTAVLLASAVLAARVSQQRRRREEHGESMPFEPIRVGGRHRLA